MRRSRSGVHTPRGWLGRLTSRLSGRFRVSYTPHHDGLPDPGEVVWAWVAYEDDPSQGKDRPVLLIGRDDVVLYGLMLTSKDHDRDAADEARWGRYWMDVGAGGWDRERRPSEVRLDRLIVLDPAKVRREGAALDEQIFRLVVRAAARFHALDEPRT
ncbi:type II toxin-antitoxin system PemK/MazF family toxin [Nocardioides sp.]|uniref:type II toxin-antitoxin system PemK/MazF family toxin n=1 Tax=Nocardioides sp. TaxID=35761 RepID=UPI0039E2F509